MNRLAGKAASVIAVVLLIAAACSIDTSTDQVSVLPSDAAPVTVTPTEPAAPVETSTPEPTAVVAEDDPTPVAEPATDPTPEVADTTPVLVQGDGWTTTQQDFDELIEFVEQTHQLTFSDPVGIVISDDIGVEFARGFEPFRAPEWWLFRGLGLADSEEQRLQANQLRLDRIRGFCCTANDSGQAVVVELQDSKFATELIIVHELVHAVHTQNPDLGLGQFPDSRESPFPAAAAFEGVPQFVTFEFLKLGTSDERSAVQPDLPIIPDDMFDRIQDGAARHLNWAYDTGPAFVDGVVDERGIQGLSDLISTPPVSTEQVMFPAKYLSGETPEQVDSPDVPGDASRQARGTIGAAMLSFLLAETNGDQAARMLVEPWAGDAYVVFERAGETCLRANLLVDTDDAANTLSVLLTEALQLVSPDSQVQARVADDLIELETCHPA